MQVPRWVVITALVLLGVFLVFGVLFVWGGHGEGFGGQGFAP